MSSFIPSLAQCFQPRFNFHSKIGERLLEVVPLSQLLFVCFACVLVSLYALSLSFTLSLSWLALVICVCVGVGVVVAALSVFSLSVPDIELAAHSGANCTNTQFRDGVGDLWLQLWLQSQFLRSLAIATRVAQKGSQQPQQATHVAGSRQRHATSGRWKYATAIIVGNKQCTVPYGSQTRVGHIAYTISISICRPLRFVHDFRLAFRRRRRSCSVAAAVNLLAVLVCSAFKNFHVSFQKCKYGHDLAAVVSLSLPPTLLSICALCCWRWAVRMFVLPPPAPPPATASSVSSSAWQLSDI